MKGSRTRTIVLSVVCFVVALGLALWVGTALRSDGGDVAESDDRALSVEDAIAQPPGARVAVRGYVFLDDPAGEVLCSQRTNGDAPRCAGIALQLRGLDSSRLDLVVAEDPGTGFDAWSRDAVELVGRRTGGTLTVEDLL